ncbi:hypothetical protein [Thermogemmatispora sp.]|uniref:hypothetical protein n=1 Tax=Thermogemmatispora sp. TaxID=1968838 RepID=UPI001DF0F170|nr:hypothetical protein [Thermogemmatispora sp.]MBX5452247.1 hypothetical protein [Thermogemmatispora sp.]
MKRRQRIQSRTWKISGFLGALLLAVGLIWLLALLKQPHEGLKLVIPHLPVTKQTSTVQLPALYTAGIILGTPAEPATITQEQALLLASHWQPEVASKAKKVLARYVLLTYIPRNANRPQMENIPAWMIIYEQVPLQPADASVDPTPFPRSSYDFYLFLDAKSGKVLLSLWT